MRQLDIDVQELEEALDNAFPEHHFFLDLETGRIVLLTDETSRALEELYAELPAGADVEEAIRQRDMPDWQREEVCLADQVETGYGTRFIRIEPSDSRSGYRDMEEFIATVQDAYLQERLGRAINGRHPFRSFKEVLDSYPHERERWFEFKDVQVHQHALEWLADHGIEPVLKPATQPTATPELPMRTRLIAEVLTFVRAARQLPGVERIALLGSLTTAKPEPKDADLLVTVANDAELAPLATLARKLQGHTQGLNRGGEVFLADPEDHYLGRICPWKRCAPGVRTSCDALHCGRRPYLHDDLDAVRLAPELVAAPPIVLWPIIRASVRIPPDIEDGLLRPLKELSETG